VTDLCHLCDYHEIVNEARDLGGETWTVPDEFGTHVFIIPKGQPAAVSLNRDGTYGSQRKAWFNEIPEHCECGEKVRLKHPLSSWKPDAAQVDPEPVPRFEPEEREVLSLV
jgi:hypothetical protein